MRSVTQGLSAAYDAKPASVAQARSAVAEFAAAAGASEEQLDGVRLAVSEAVTNAVLHAYRGAPGQIQVTAALAGRELWILVSDDGGGMHPQADAPGLGFGLGLISQVSDDMAIVPRSAGGTEVRILFKLAPLPEPGPAEPRSPRRSQSESRRGAPRRAEMAGAPAPADLSAGILGRVSAAPAAPLPD